MQLCSMQLCIIRTSAPIFKVMELTVYWKTIKSSWPISLCSVRGTLNNSSQCSKLLYMTFGLWGFSLWRPVSLSVSALVEGHCPPPIHYSRYLVCTAHNDDLSKYPVQFRFNSRFKVLCVWDWKQSSYFMDFTSKSTIHTSFSISSFLTMGCSTPAFLRQLYINYKYTCFNRTLKFWPQWDFLFTISLSCPSETQHLFTPAVFYWKFPILLQWRMWDMMLYNCRNVSQHFEALGSFRTSGTVHPVT